MAKNFPDTVTVITGASSGIGRATALALARRGGTVVVTARRENALRELSDQCERLGGRALALPADVTNEEQVKSVARQAVENFGRIDVWLNNAAVTLFARIEEAPIAAYRRVIETNLFGCIHGARAAIPHFREQGSGTIINVSSMVAETGSPYVSAYAVAKSGIMSLSRSLRMELRDAPGIHVCTVYPASIDTPLFQQGANFTGRAVQPIPPVYRAERVADAIVSLIRRPRKEVAVGNSGRMIMLTYRLAPPLAVRLYARQVEKKHFQDRPALSSEGNLFKPMREYDTVSGGWSNGNGRLPRGMLLGLTALGIGVGVLVGRASRPKVRGYREGYLPS